MVENKKPWYKRWWVIVIFVLVGLAIIGSFLPDTETDTSSSSNTPSSSENTPEEATALPETNNYQTCIKGIFESECQKMGLVYTDYSSAVGFITCTDDGVYSMDDIGNDNKYLQVYAPTMILEKKCGTYTAPTNTKLKCQADFFESQCQKEGLIYTDWSSAVGFITCTDDGVYNLGEIGEETKYKQVYVTSEFVNSKCP